MQFRQPTATEISELGQLASQTFGFPQAKFALTVERIGAENLRVAVEDGKLNGGLAVYRLEQWLGGRAIPMAGVALVCVPPTTRAGGTGRWMMSRLLEELQATGTPLATLFPSTQVPYRRVGFEQAGTWNQFQLPLTQIGRQRRLVPIHEVPLEAQSFHSLATHRASISNGNLSRSPGIWDRLFAPTDPEHPVRGYLLGDRDNPDGYIVFEQSMPQRIEDRCLLVRDMYARTGKATETLWAFLHGHRSIFPNLRWYGPPTDPLLAATEEARAIPVFNDRWMVRMADVPEALQQRGYPTGVKETLDLEVRDELIPGNHGRFQLRVSEGNATVTPGGDGSVQIDVAALAPLFTSFLSASNLQTLGRITASDQELQRADAIFAGPEPWMPEKF